MAERRTGTLISAEIQQKQVTWKHEPPQPRRGRVLWTLLVLAGLAGAVVVADGEWAWRDSLRRLAKGEEIPAFRANEWEDAAAVRESLAEELLTTDLIPSVEERDMRRSLALCTLVSAAGDAVIAQGGQPMWGLMEELCLDLDWLEEMVSFCPMELAARALPVLARIYQAEKKKMAGSPGNRRFATAIAFEFARAGLNEEQALASYLFYASSGQKHWLNKRFDSLSLWQMSAIAARLTDSRWSSETTLAWCQRNCSLPSQGYVSLVNILKPESHCLFGEEVGSDAFVELYRDSAEGGAASMLEAAGSSTAEDRAFYVATAACANGVPALVAGSGDAVVCLVDVDGRWEATGPLPEGAECSWSYDGHKQLDFVQLASTLGREKDKTLAAARLAGMGQFIYDSGNQPLAHSFFREALKVQPLRYATWAAYAACGAPQAELDKAAECFRELPGVAAALSAARK